MNVILDACVLYPTVMRDLLLRCAGAGMYSPFWSARILQEWARAAAKSGVEQAELARGEIAIMRRDWPDACVEIPPGTEARLYLPDGNDIHVLAAGIHGSCELIVTANLKDFPRRLLGEHGLRAQHPDEFLLRFFNSAPDRFSGLAEAVRAQAEHLSGHNWPMGVLMKKARLPRLGRALARFEQGPAV